MNPGGTMGFSNPSNEDISIITASTTKVFIKQDGNVGIGTVSPASKLQVAGETRSTSFTNVGALGSQSGNARNHFTPLNAGNITIASGWIAAAFGDASNNRVVIGQANVGNGAIIGGHTANLDAWADLTTVAVNHLFLKADTLIFHIHPAIWYCNQEKQIGDNNLFH
jgi:hypothetical protein